MKKVILSLIAVFCVAQLFAQHDTRTVTHCGYSSYEKAQNAGMQATMMNAFQNPDEELISDSYDYVVGSGWCYTNTYQCNLQPLTKRVNESELKLPDSLEERRTL